MSTLASSTGGSQSQPVKYKSKPGQEELPISIIVWEGLKSAYPATSIPINSFTQLVNKDLVSPTTISTRPGASILYMHYDMGYTVAAYEFNQSNGSSFIVWATRDGRLFRTPTQLYNRFYLGTYETQNLPPDPEFIGYLTTGVGLSNVRFAIFKNKLWIADGYNAWVYDPSSSPTLQNYTSTVGAPSGSKIIAVKTHNYRLWYLTDTDQLRGSALNDPSNFTSGTAWNATIGDNDGMSNRTLTRWGKAMIITKHDTETGRYAMYLLQGSSSTNFQIDQMFGDEDTPTGFVGNSAVQVGNDVIGLTTDGFTTVSAVQNFQESQLSLLSEDIDDLVRRINFGAASIIRGVYDTATRQYMCAVPLDNSPFNNIILVYDRRKQRWSTYDNWPVIDFFKVKTLTCFVGNTSDRYDFNVYGRDEEGASINEDFYAIEPHPSDDYTRVVYRALDTGLPIYNNNFLFLSRRGNYFTDDVFGKYRKVIELSDATFDAADALKMFKALDFNITQDNDYKLLITPVIDGDDDGADTWELDVDADGTDGEFTGDVSISDGEANSQETLPLGLRGKTLRVRFENNELNQSFSLRSITFRLFKTDSGNLYSRSRIKRVQKLVTQDDE